MTRKATDAAGSSTLSSITLAVVIAVILVPIGVDLAIAARATSIAGAAADGAALAAVGAQRPTSATTPRRAASDIASANGATLVSCDCTAAVVTVEVSVPLRTLLLHRLGVTEVRASATATLVDASSRATVPLARAFGARHERGRARHGNRSVVHSFTHRAQPAGAHR